VPISSTSAAINGRHLEHFLCPNFFIVFLLPLLKGGDFYPVSSAEVCCTVDATARKDAVFDQNLTFSFA
jgi:hypothetical protein